MEKDNKGLAKEVMQDFIEIYQKRIRPNLKKGMVNRALIIEVRDRYEIAKEIGIHFRDYLQILGQYQAALDYLEIISENKDNKKQVEDFFLLTDRRVAGLDLALSNESQMGAIAK